MDAKETSIFAAVLISCIVVLGLIVLFTIIIIRHQRRSLTLYKAKVLAEITTLENERKRVAADLHDELGPIVAGLKLKLNSLDVNLPEDKDTLERVHQHITELIMKMKVISNDLMPVLLLKKGVVAATQRTVEDINESGKLVIELTDHDLPPLPELLSVNLFRILQEIMHNTIKHANASRLTIELRLEKNKVIVETSDDGTGFDYKTAVKEHAGLGLRNLLSRTEVLNGRMYINSIKNEGTHYVFEIPL